jgi:hypothetical protein
MNGCIFRITLKNNHEDTNDCKDAGGTTPRMGDDCTDAGGRATQGAVAEVESRREKRSRAMHGAIADDCKDAGGRAMHGAIAENTKFSIFVFFVLPRGAYFGLRGEKCFSLISIRLSSL